MIGRFANGLAPAGVVLALALAPTTAQGVETSPLRVAFDQDTPVTTTEGHATLSWATPQGEPTASDVVEFELQNSRKADFGDALTWYRGPDRASFVSGLPEGTTWFRVRVAPDQQGRRAGPWSEPVAIEVTYATRSMLIRLLALGAIVFVATVATVIRGQLRHAVPVR